MEKAPPPSKSATGFYVIYISLLFTSLRCASTTLYFASGGLVICCWYCNWVLLNGSLLTATPSLFKSVTSIYADFLRIYSSSKQGLRLSCLSAFLAWLYNYLYFMCKPVMSVCMSNLSVYRSNVPSTCRLLY